MHKSDLVIATMTWARNAHESQVLLASVKMLSRSGVRIIVCDGGSDDNFLDELRSIPNIQIHRRSRASVFGQMRISLRQAYDTNIQSVLYTEADKLVFFRERLDDFIRAAPDSLSIGIAVPSRNEKAMSSFPPGQQMMERFMNNLCGEVLGTHTDLSYGPLMINRALLPCLWDVDKKNRLGMAVLSVRGSDASGLPDRVCRKRFLLPERSTGRDGKGCAP